MKRLWLNILLLTLLSCTDNEDDGADLNFIVPTINPKGDEQYLHLGSEFIFDQNVLHTFELKIPKEDLEKIDSDPVAEQYVEGMLIFEGDTISPVGIRYKGSIGAFVGCVDGADWAEPSGKKICTKLSMKVKIRIPIELKRRFTINKTNFNDNISISEIIASIQAIDGVNAVETFKVVNKTSADNTGTMTYSGFNFDINANTFSGIVSFPQDVVWEMKYPNLDIVARYTGGTSAPGSGGGTGGGY